MGDMTLNFIRLRGEKRMKKTYLVFTIFFIATLILGACAPAPEPEELTTAEGMPSADEIPAEETTEEGEDTTAEDAGADTQSDSIWTQAYITEVPPIMMSDPYFEIFGQTDGAIPYYYEEAVKLSGHSCGAVSGAWTITRKALEVLYPDGEIPVRGQIAVEAPGAEDEWFVGVFGEVITYITGAAPKTGFIGAEFGKTDDVFVRQNKMVYAEEPTEQLPPMREWIFTRLDTGARVGVKFNLMVITPIPTPGRVAMGKKMAAGEATPEEAEDYYEYWNDRALFVFENADTMDGFFPVTIYE
jgi:hypothetical protein